MNMKYIAITISMLSLTNLTYGMNTEYTKLINEQNTTYSATGLQDNKIALMNHPLSKISEKKRCKILFACLDKNSIENTNQNLINQAIDADILHIFPAEIRKNFIEECAQAFTNGKISSLYHKALRKNCFILARVILGSGLVDVNCKNSKGYTGLMLAADRYDVDTLKFLIAEEADLEIKHDAIGHTALEMVAAQNKWEDAFLQSTVVKLLVDAGAETRIAKKLARTKGNPILFNPVINLLCPIQ